MYLLKNTKLIQVCIIPKNKKGQTIPCEKKVLSRLGHYNLYLTYIPLPSSTYVRYLTYLTDKGISKKALFLFYTSQGTYNECPKKDTIRFRSLSENPTMAFKDILSTLGRLERIELTNLEDQR